MKIFYIAFLITVYITTVYGEEKFKVCGQKLVKAIHTTCGTCFKIPDALTTNSKVVEDTEGTAEMKRAFSVEDYRRMMNLLNKHGEKKKRNISVSDYSKLMKMLHSKGNSMVKRSSVGKLIKKCCTGLCTVNDLKPFCC